MFVKDAMTNNPVTVTPTTTLPELVSLMKTKQIRRVPVLDNDKLVGIVSDHDVMSSMPSAATTLSRWEMNTLLNDLSAKDIMISPVYTTTPNCPIEEVAQALLEHKFGALPVVEAGKLVGIITESDLFRTFVEMLSGGDVPGLRFELRVERHRGVLAQLSSIVNDNGGGIIAIATINDADGIHKRVMVKEEGADQQLVREALEAVDIEVLDVRTHGQCSINLI